MDTIKIEPVTNVEVTFQLTNHNSYHSSSGTFFEDGETVAGWVWEDTPTPAARSRLLNKMRWDVNGKMLNESEWAEVIRGIKAAKIGVE